MSGQLQAPDALTLVLIGLEAKARSVLKILVTANFT
jgi:hypothetical protein